jgi:hypothetical protein
LKQEKHHQSTPFSNTRKIRLLEREEEAEKALKVEI